MSVAGSQQRTFLQLLDLLRPHWRRDPALPARIQSLLASRREFGARDRRLYRELVYTTLRYLPWIEPVLDTDSDEAIRRIAWLAAETPATRAFTAAFATGVAFSDDKTALLPAWFQSHCREIFSGAELDAQLRRAPVWLRLQTDAPERVLAEFDSQSWQWRRPAVLPSAVELLTEADVTQTRAWKSGQVEVQDLGSQLIQHTVGIEPGGRWLDSCAGAGGKTLQLACLLGPNGKVDAHDIRPQALVELRTRAARAGVVCHPLDDKTSSSASTRNAAEELEVERLDPKPLSVRPTGRKRVEVNSLHLVRRNRDSTASFQPRGDNRFASITVRTRLAADEVYDGVLVDAPCSGSGTWRRAPHLKWTTTEAQVTRAAELQRKLLGQFAGHVRPGGCLIYATCSLSSRENEEVVADFLAEHHEFGAAHFATTGGATPRGAGLTIFPSLHDTDGFFVASLRRR